LSISSQNSLVGGISPWQVLESLGESVVVDDDRFRVVWIKEPLLAQSKPGVNPLGQYCFSVLFDRTSPCVRHCPVKHVLASGRPSLVERRFIGPDGIARRREVRAYSIVDIFNKLGVSDRAQAAVWAALQGLA